MARSHLTHCLLRSYGLATQAQAVGLSSQAAITHGSSEASAVATDLTDPPVNLAHGAAPPDPTTRPVAKSMSGDSLVSPVLVVGAGLAGLVVAYRLRQAGIPVDVVEGRDRIGGRILSAQDILGTGLTAEIGGEVFDSGHRYCLNLAQELGLPTVDIYEWLPADVQPTYFFGQRWVSLAELAEHFLPLIPRMESDREAVRQFLQTGQVMERVKALDQLSICEYMAQLTASPLLQSVAQVAYTIKYGMDAEAQSCLNLLAFIRPQAGEFNLFGSSDERYFIQGGNGQLTERLATAIAPCIETGTVLEALRHQPDGRYRVSLRAGGWIGDRTYERVVLTLPFNILRSLSLEVDLPPQKRQAIDTLGYNCPTKLITAYRQKRWLTQYRNNGLIFTDLPSQHAWESSGSVLSPEIGLLTNYTGGHHSRHMASMDLLHHTEAVVADLDHIFPGLKTDYFPVGAVRSQWLTDDFSQGAYSCYRVGQWTTLHGHEGGRVGNLFFAGEHCSHAHQGYMEGACETGEQVALEILADMRSPLTDFHPPRLELS